MNLINGNISDTIEVYDRGFSYGDGVFRTFPVSSGKPRLWHRHYKKLHADCAKLGIVCPAADLFEGDLKYIADRQVNCVVRITVTRGVSARGYAAPPPDQVQPTRIVTASSLPQFPPEYTSHGIAVRLCNTRLAKQPALAGIKHLNRLENVLARSEWNDPKIAEGIMCDTAGTVIAGTMSNLFLVAGGGLKTPDLTGCGVAGVQRERVIEMAVTRGIAVAIEPVTVEQLLAADEVFLINSVIGIWQVASFQEKIWNAGSMTVQFRQWLSDAAD